MVKGPTQGLDNTTWTAEAEYPNNYTGERDNFLSLHYNITKSYLFANGVKNYQLRAKDSELNAFQNILQIAI